MSEQHDHARCWGVVVVFAVVDFWLLIYRAIESAL
jgi:hypothetical protein